MSVNEQYLNLIAEMEKTAKNFFAYSGSARMQNSLSLNEAYRGITKETSEIEKLVKLGIVPMIEVGSRSQRNLEFSTNYCLDTFKELGFTESGRIIEIAEWGITPFHLFHTDKSGINIVQLRLEALFTAVNKVYAGKFIPIRQIKFDLYQNHFTVYETSNGNQPIAPWEMAFAQRLAE